MKVNVVQETVMLLPDTLTLGNEELFGLEWRWEYMPAEHDIRSVWLLHYPNGSPRPVYAMSRRGSAFGAPAFL